MPDDPLFDPWSTVEALPSDEVTESETDSTAQASQTRQERQAPRWRPAPKTGEMPRRRPVPPSEVDHAARRPPSRGSSTLTERLKDVGLPCLKAIGARLRIARHRTLLDDRLDRDPPTIRFRLIPRRGPFDDASAVPGSVLEFVADGGSSVTARLWLDPVAEEPTDERQVEGTRFGEAWIDEIAMDFVERALRRR